MEGVGREATSETRRTINLEDGRLWTRAWRRCGCAGDVRGEEGDLGETWDLTREGEERRRRRDRKKRRGRRSRERAQEQGEEKLRDCSCLKL